MPVPVPLLLPLPPLLLLLLLPLLLLLLLLLPALASAPPSRAPMRVGPDCAVLTHVGMATQGWKIVEYVWAGVVTPNQHASLGVLHELA